MKPRDIDSGLTAEELRKLVEYDKRSGLFIWRANGNNQFAVAGSSAGWVEPKTGYLRIKINGRKYMAHRLAWLYVEGRWPIERIDHRDTNRSNNRWNNLREASNRRNSANKRTSISNKLGIKGVEFHVSGKYRARIFVDGRHLHLGLFETSEAASAAYYKAASHYFGEFARSA